MSPRLGIVPSLMGRPAEMPTEHPTPTPADFRSHHESLIRFLDTEPDGQGRRRFAGYWLEQGRVRGQVWHTDPAYWTSRAEREGGTVRVLESSDAELTHPKETQ